MAGSAQHCFSEPYRPVSELRHYMFQEGRFTAKSYFSNGRDYLTKERQYLHQKQKEVHNRPRR